MASTSVDVPGSGRYNGRGGSKGSTYYGRGGKPKHYGTNPNDRIFKPTTRIIFNRRENDPCKKKEGTPSRQKENVPASSEKIPNTCNESSSTKENTSEGSNPDDQDFDKVQKALDEKCRQLHSLQFKLTLCKTEISNRDQELQRHKASLTSLKNLFDKSKETMELKLEEQKTALAEKAKKEQDMLSEMRQLQEKIERLKEEHKLQMAQKDLEVTALTERLAAKEDEIASTKKSLTELQTTFDDQLNEKFGALKKQVEDEGKIEISIEGNELVENESMKLKSTSMPLSELNSAIREITLDWNDQSFEALKMVLSTTSDETSLTDASEVEPDYHSLLVSITETLIAVVQASREESKFLKQILNRDAEVQADLNEK